MNETERIISDLCEQKNYWKMRYKLNGDEDSNKYVTVIDMAIKALEEKLERDKDCEYCAEDKCRLCTLLCDYWGDGGTDKCSADGIDDPCAYYNLINYCPKCGRKLVNENETD